MFSHPGEPAINRNLEFAGLSESLLHPGPCEHVGRTTFALPLHYFARLRHSHRDTSRCEDLSTLTWLSCLRVYGLLAIELCREGMMSQRGYGHDTSGGSKHSNFHFLEPPPKQLYHGRPSSVTGFRRRAVCTRAATIAPRGVYWLVAGIQNEILMKRRTYERPEQPSRSAARLPIFSAR